MATLTIGDNTGNTVGTDDTFLYQGNPTQNESAQTEINVFKWAVSDWGVGLIRFPGLSALPAGSVITAVTVNFTRSGSIGAAGSQTWSFYPVLQNWIEAEATWNNYSTASAWNSGGAQGSGTDRTTPATGAITIGTSNGTVYSTSDAGLATDLNNYRAGLNYGWMIERTDAGIHDSTSVQVVSSRGADGDRPTIVVTYRLRGGLALAGVG